MRLAYRNSPGPSPIPPQGLNELALRIEDANLLDVFIQQEEVTR